ncbi:MAG: HD domain-containing protein [Candidatus Methanomethylophilaceae archaeon]|jgi:HD superfamily phosphohydrolase|nr:HD domain-containing protein [Candidatus Methanomethylophilaceae archaeon]NLF33680.1 HD domain-containing protein [Thermoplasmatales archaeon]
MGARKMIQDPVHGSIPVDGLFLEILNRHEMQRLRRVRQLGMGNMVFPGANHTRFEHCMGVFHLAGRMASNIGLEREDSDTVRAAALLHDVCHPAFSHTMEDIMEDRTGMDHMGLARALITGTVPNRLSRDRDLGEEPPPIGEVLEGSGISADTVCDLISYPESRTFSLESFAEGNRASYFPSKDYVHQIIHGPVDADQMDYLIRDAHYTGVSHGSIDTDRLLNTMRVHNDRIVLEKGGISAAEGLMVSRALMYSSVYYHRTVRLAEMMLTKAADTSGLDLSEIYLMSDFDLTSAIISSGGRSSRIVRDLLDRRLYKSALVLYTIDLDEDTSTVLQRYLPYHKRRALEWEIAEAAGVDDQDVLVDIPLKSALMDMAKIGKTDVSILDREGRVRSITKYSPIAKALQTRDTLDWAMAVSAPRGKREAVERAARKVLSL